MYQRGINLCGIEYRMKTTTPSTGDPAQFCGTVVSRVSSVTFKTATGGSYSHANCNFVSSDSSTTRSASSLDICGNLCVASSDCNYFTYKKTTCTFMVFATSVKPFAYVDSTQSCGSVVSRVSSVTFTNATGGSYSYANCNFLTSGGVSSTTFFLFR